MVYKDINLITDNKIEKVDIKIENGAILNIGKIEDKDSIDGSSSYIFPSLIDLNVKLCDEKVSEANLKRLSKSVKSGGVGKVALRPDMNPLMDNEIILEFIKSFRFENLEIFPIVMAINSENRLSDIAILLKKGASAIFIYSDIDSFLIARVFEYAKMYNKPIFCVARNSSIRSVGVMHEGEVSAKLGLGGISEIEEISEVAKIIEFSKFYDVKVLFKSMSSCRSIELIDRAKKEGISVFSEVSIHHLLKTDRECLGYNTDAKIDPPLRDEKNREKLLEFLKDGKIDILTSLHSPKSITQKDISFDEAAFGVDSIKTYLNDLYENFVKSEILTFPKLLNLTVFNPAKILDIDIDIKRDFVLFKPNSF